MRVSSPLAAALAVACILPLISLSTGCNAVPDRSGDDSGSAQATGSADATAAEAAVPADYRQEIQDWRADRKKSLTRPGGWLTLVGLFWLHPGANTFGSAEGSDLVFPDKAPDHAGALVLADDGTVTLKPAEAGSGATGGATLAVVHDATPDGAEAADGDEAAELAETLEPVTGPVTMVPDSEKETTEVSLGSLRFWVIVRGEKIGVRLLDRESPAIAAFKGIESFPIDPAWKVEAHLERRDDFTVPMPNILGQVEDAPSPGILHFKAPSGEDLSLIPLGEGDSLFIVFGDKTNGHTTYGGGRFLYADAPAKDDPDPVVVLDFNRAYNPPCAFTEFATCPLPPRPNKLPIAVEAGEKRYADGPTHHAPATGE